MKKVIILGAGVAGLTVAYRLSRKGYKVKVIEKENYIGGMLGPIRIDNYFIERYYHHVFHNDNELFQLLDELGLKNQLIEIKCKTGFYHKNRIFNLSGAIDLLKYKPLSFIDKIKLGLFMLKIKRIKNPEEHSEEPLKEWIIKNSSKNIYEKVFLPLLKSKYGSNFDDTSTAWFIERMKIRAQRDISGEKLIYMEGGFQQLIDKLREEIIKNGGEILTKTEVKKLITGEGSIKKIRYDSKEETIDFIISTIPPHALNKRIDFPTGLEEHEYQGTVCILLGLNKSLCNYYWTNIITEEGISFGSYIEHTNLVPKSNYGGNILAYLASYPDKDSDVWKMSDAKVFRKYFDDLKKIFDVRENNIIFWRVFKTRHAGLIYKRGIKKDIMKCETKIPNLFVCGMFNSYPERSINLSIKLANECVKLIGG